MCRRRARNPPKSNAQKAAKAVEVSVCAVLLTLVCPFACVYLGTKCLYDGCRGLIPGANERAEASRCRAEKTKLQKEAPKPMGRRKRALTLPLPDQRNDVLPWKPAQRTEDQSQSAFFGRLPYEIREMIYEYALAGSMHIHIFRRTDRRLGHYKCYREHRPLQETYYDYHGKACRSSTEAWIPRRWKDDQISEVLPLLRTCRRVCVMLLRKRDSKQS